MPPPTSPGAPAPPAGAARASAASSPGRPCERVQFLVDDTRHGTSRFTNWCKELVQNPCVDRLVNRRSKCRVGKTHGSERRGDSQMREPAYGRLPTLLFKGVIFCAKTENQILGTFFAI